MPIAFIVGGIYGHGGRLGFDRSDMFRHLLGNGYIPNI